MCLDKPFRHPRGMCLMQDGVTSHTAHTTLSLLQAHRVNVLPWPSKSPDHNPIKHNRDVIGRVVRRRGLAKVDNLHVCSKLQWTDGTELYSAC